MTKERTVNIYIPSQGSGPYVEGAINGVSFRLPTDRVVEVPERIALVVMESRKELLRGEDAVAAYTQDGGRKLWQG